MFWQSLFADCVYLIDEELFNLIDELTRQGVKMAEEMEKMVFIPRLEDIVEFCAASIFTLELSVSPSQERAIYRARLSIASLDKSVCEETHSGLRVAALRAFVMALQDYFPTFLPSNTLSTPI